jgi:hypothetical protein
MKTGTASLPLHGGKAPAWLFGRMKKLAREISVYIIGEFGPDNMLARLSDPFWFQAFGCVLGFDWHSSGLTTTVCAAVKEGLKGVGGLGFHPAGGKGGTSRKTPGEIERVCETTGTDASPLVYASRMSAKVDSAAIQDGYQLYHHSFFFTDEGKWCVVQQGMNEDNRTARRYHWRGEDVSDPVCEPHSGVCADRREERVLNMVARESADARDRSAEAARLEPAKLFREVEAAVRLDMPRRHGIETGDISSKHFARILVSTYEAQPDGFESLLGMKGVGGKTIRALSLISELVYGAEPSFRDPARFSFAHGGKDGIPYPVARETYDETVEVFRKALNASRADVSEKKRAFGRLRHIAAPAD